jgi:hypothetical protein
MLIVTVMRVYMHIYVIVSMLILNSSIVYAGTIRMAFSLRTAITGDQIKVGIEVENRGDEAAFDVKTWVELSGIKRLLFLKKKLEPRDSCGGELVFPLSSRRGWYPIIAEIYYTDANGHPYYVDAVSKYAIDGRESEVTVEFKKPENQNIPLRLDINKYKKKEFFVILTNNSSKRKTIEVRFVYPGNIAIEPAKSNVSLGPMEKKRITLTIQNRSFNPGSSLPVHVLTEYDKDGLHYLDDSSMIITVEKEGDHSSIICKALVVAGILLGIIIIMSFFRGGRP